MLNFEKLEWKMVEKEKFMEGQSCNPQPVLSEDTTYNYTGFENIDTVSWRLQTIWIQLIHHHNSSEDLYSRI